MRVGIRSALCRRLMAKGGGPRRLARFASKPCAMTGGAADEGTVLAAPRSPVAERFGLRVRRWSTWWWST